MELCSVIDLRHRGEKGKIVVREWRIVVANHSRIRARARGWCDNGGVAMKYGKWQRLAFKQLFYTMFFWFKESKANSRSRWQLGLSAIVTMLTC